MNRPTAREARATTDLDRLLEAIYRRRAKLTPDEIPDDWRLHKLYIEADRLTRTIIYERKHANRSWWDRHPVSSR